MSRSATRFFGKCAIVLLLLAALLLAESWLAGQLSFLGALCLGSPCLLAVSLLFPRVTRAAAPKHKRRMPLPVPPPLGSTAASVPFHGNCPGPHRKAA